jgi:hypothetical protein
MNRPLTLLKESVTLILFLIFLRLTLAAGQELPKILVAQDGRSFVTGQGKPFVPFA